MKIRDAETVRFDPDTETRCGNAECPKPASTYIYITLRGMDCGRKFCQEDADQARQEEEAYRIGL